MAGTAYKLPYTVSSYRKRSIVYADNYGVSETELTIRPTEKFKRIRHFFGLGDSAFNDIKFDRFSGFQSRIPVKEKFNRQFFECFFDTSVDHPEVRTSTEGDREDSKEIFFEFKKDFVPGQEFTYRFAWGCPSLFPCKKGDLKFLRKRHDYVEHRFNVNHAIDKFKFEILFDKVIVIEDNPLIHVMDATGQCVDRIRSLKVGGLFYDKYSMEIPTCIPHGYSLGARWTPKY